MSDLARELTQTLEDTARDLGLADGRDGEDLTSVLSEMPRLDVPTWIGSLSPSFRLKLSARMEGRRVEQKLSTQIGSQVTKAFYNLAKMLSAWAQRSLNEIQLHFDAQADKYRAHLIRLGDSRSVSQDEEASLRQDLDRLVQSETATRAEVTDRGP